MEGGFVMTEESLKKLCRDLKMYSSCPELNDVIHLHQKGITIIQALEKYKGLRTVYLECNAISKLDGLAPLINLRCLYLNQNCVEHIIGLETLQQLEILDLADNQIRKVMGLSMLPHLRQVNLAGNCICCANDVIHLTECRSLKSLDLSKNRIDNEAALDVLRSIPLNLLRMTGNHVLNVTHYYRKQTIATMPTLCYLDESPIFEKERRLALAWVEGGLNAEKEMRTIIANEEAALRDRHRKAFEDMQVKARKDHAEKLLRQEQMRIEEAQIEAERGENERVKLEQLGNERLKQEELDAQLQTKLTNSEVETKGNEDIKFEERCIDNSTTENDNAIFVNQSQSLQSDGKKRGAEELNNENNDRNEYPQKSHKIEPESMQCDDVMELDHSQQEMFKSTYTKNLESYNVKEVAINQFLEAMSKQQQRNISKYEEHYEKSHEENIPLDVSFTTSSIPMKVNNMNQREEIFGDDIKEQITTNTLITNHDDQCQLKEQGISNFLHDDDGVKGWNFRRGLQDRLLLKEVINTEKRGAEIASEVNGNTNELIRPVIWGTNKYHDLWAIASTIDEDVQMDNKNPLEEEEVQMDNKYPFEEEEVQMDNKNPFEEEEVQMDNDNSFEEEVWSSKDTNANEVLKFSTTAQASTHRSDEVMDIGAKNDNCT